MKIVIEDSWFTGEIEIKSSDSDDVAYMRMSDSKDE